MVNWEEEINKLFDEGDQEIVDEEEFVKDMSGVAPDLVARMAFKALARSRCAIFLALIVLQSLMSAEGVGEKGLRESRLAVLDEALRMTKEHYKVHITRI